jgi:hypothetical protein
MAVTFKVVKQWEDTQVVHVIGTLVFSGNYVTGGDSLNFGALSADTLGVSIKSGSPPLWIAIQATGGYNFVGTPLGTPFVPVTPNTKVQTYVDSTGLELAAAAYPGALLASGAQFAAQFPKHI